MGVRATVYAFPLRLGYRLYSGTGKMRVRYFHDKSFKLIEPIQLELRTKL
jgi:hypothetical protein